MNTEINRSVPGSSIGLQYSINEQDKLIFQNNDSAWAETSLKEVATNYSNSSKEYKTALATVRTNVLSKVAPSISEAQREQVIEGKLTAELNLLSGENKLAGKIKVCEDGAGSSIKLIKSLKDPTDHHLVKAGLISKEEVNKLSSGENKYLASTNTKGTIVLYKFDKETNSLIPHTPKEVNLPVSIGDSKLTSEQVQKLANGRSIENFTTNINGVQKTGTLNIKGDRVKLAMEKSKKTGVAIDPSTKLDASYGEKADKMIAAINKKDFRAIKEIKTKDGFAPNDTFLQEHVLSNKNLKSDKDKLLVMTSMGVKSKDSLEKIRTHNAKVNSNLPAGAKKNKKSKGAMLDKQGQKLGTGMKRSANKIESSISRGIGGM